MSATQKGLGARSRDFIVILPIHFKTIFCNLNLPVTMLIDLFVKSGVTFLQ